MPRHAGRRDEPDLISAKRLARDLPKDAWQTIQWRVGSAECLSSRFARVRVRVGHSQLKPELLSEEWLLIEWPEGEAEPTKYWLSTLPANISFRDLVERAIGIDAMIILFPALAAAERSGAVIAGAGVDSIENDHGCQLP